MMKKTDCGIIEDLMPLYIDGLTSEASNRLIEEHLKECEECRKKLERMKRPDITVTKDDVKEIDFLKKTRKHNRKMIFGSILAALLLITGVIGTRLYVTGSVQQGDWMACEVQVDGKHLTAEAVSFSGITNIGNIKFTEEDGIVYGTARAVLPSFLSHDIYHTEYTAKQPVKAVYINGTAVWADGEAIKPITGALFNTAHEYVGDMPANQRTANVLNLSGRFGSYKNELITDSQPYRWKILMEENVTSKNRKDAEISMEKCAYVMIALTGNLDEVEFVYTADNESVSKVITKAEADEYFGGDVHTCMNDVKVLNELIEKTGLNY